VPPNQIVKLIMNHNPPLIPRVSPYAVWYYFLRAAGAGPAPRRGCARTARRPCRTRLFWLLF